MTRRLRSAWLLSVVTVTLTVVATVSGLLVDDLYRDPVSLSSMLRGYDLITLVSGVPVLAAALIGVRRGLVRAQLAWVAMLAYTVYNYSYYVFPTQFNDLFLVHVAVFATALFALVLALSGLDVPAIAASFARRTPVRWIAGLLGLMAVALGVMWIYNAVRFAVTGDFPASSVLVETDAVVHLGYVLDLSLLVPAYALAAVLLWRRTPWGFVLASVMAVSSAVHQIAYLVALPFQVNANVPGAVAFDPAEPVIAAIFLFVAAGLLVSAGRATKRA